MNKKMVLLAMVLMASTSLSSASGKLTPDDLSSVKKALGEKGNFFNKTDILSDAAVDQPQPRIVRSIRNAGWDKSPSLTRWLSSIVLLIGPGAVNMYVMSRLKRDRQARLLKLTKEQSGGGMNPFVQMLMQMQQKGGMGGAGLSEDEGFDEDGQIKLPDSAQAPDKKVLEWNPDDILTPGKRRLYQTLSWIATALFFAGGVQLFDTAKDAYHGHSMPSVMHHLMQGVNSDSDLVEEVANKVEEYASLPQRDARAKFLEYIPFGPTFARHAFVNSSTKKDNRTKQ